MKQGISAFIVATLLAASAPARSFYLPDSDQRTCYEAASPWSEIPCAGTGQDGAYSVNPLSYTDHGNGTVTDNNTGLVWQKEDDGNTYNWYRASGTHDPYFNPDHASVCGSLDLGGATDWRLPSKKELTGIVDMAIPSPGPTIRTAFFPNTKGALYWTATTYASNPDHAWDVYFSDGYVGGSSRGSEFYVRCVRGGP